MKEITLRTKKSRLLRLATYLEGVPRRKFDQNHFCSTACCIAGHAVLRFGTTSEIHGMLKAMRTYDHDPGFSVDRRAKSLLGLTGDERFTLFKGPNSWALQYQTPKGNVTPRLAAKALRDLANTIHT